MQQTLVPLPTLSRQGKAALEEHEVSSLAQLTTILRRDVKAWTGISPKTLAALDLALRTAGLEWLHDPQDDPKPLDPREKTVRETWAALWKEERSGKYPWDLSLGPRSNDMRAARDIAAVCHDDATLEDVMTTYLRKSSGEWPNEAPTLPGLSRRWAVWASRRQVRRPVEVDLDIAL
jgi:hypothetical protein